MKKNSEKTIYGTYKLAVEKIVRFPPFPCWSLTPVLTSSYKDNGDHTPSFVFDALQSTPREKLTKEEEEAIISVALSMYGG
jgi:hypothetical protein